jgi:sugar lactone lactonase YvrE
LGTIVAGTGVAGAGFDQLYQPWGIYVDESDNDALYVADFLNNRVMKWLPGATNGTIVAGGNGAGALYTQLYYPTYVFVDSFGTIYVSEYTNQRVTKWLKGASNGTLVAGISGSAGFTSQQLYTPVAFRFDTNGYLYVCSYTANHVQRFDIDNSSC